MQSGITLEEISKNILGKQQEECDKEADARTLAFSKVYPGKK